MVAVVVRAVRLLAVSGSSCSTRSAGGHSFRARGGSRRTPLHTGYGRPHTRDTWPPVRLRNIALGRQFPISSAADRLFAVDAEALPDFGVLKCLGPHAVEKLMQQLVQKHVLSLNLCLNNGPRNGKAKLDVQRLSAQDLDGPLWGISFQAILTCKKLKVLSSEATQFGLDTKLMQLLARDNFLPIKTAANDLVKFWAASPLVSSISLVHAFNWASLLSIHGFLMLSGKFLF